MDEKPIEVTTDHPCLLAILTHRLAERNEPSVPRSRPPLDLRIPQVLRPEEPVRHRLRNKAEDVAVTIHVSGAH